MNFTYRIDSVNEEYNIMEVTYTHDTHGDTTVSMEIPYDDYDFESYINAYAPRKIWENKEKTRATVSVGETGEITVPETTQIDYNKVLLDIYKDAPPASLDSIEKIKQVDRKYIKIREFYRNAHPIALELLAPTEQDAPSEVYARSMRSIGNLVQYASKIGIPFFGITNSKGFRDYCLKYTQLKEYGLSSEFIILYKEWNESMASAVAEAKKQSVREKRDVLLADTDWIYLPDTVTPDNMPEWETYRQALRDVPQQEGFPSSVVWPEQPEKKITT